MKNIKRKVEIILLVSLISITLLYLFCNDEKPEEVIDLDVPPGYTYLFNGKNLKGWLVEPDNGAFFVTDGKIICSGELRPPHVALSEKQYENFILELDFKISPQGNSGIFIHAPIDGRQSKNGFEIQIQDDFGKPVSPYVAGAMYDLAAPDTNAIRLADLWNHYKIQVEWPNVKVWLNDAPIHDVDMSQNHIMRYRRRIGYIGLQNHGSPVEFQNIFIKELPGTAKYDTLFNGQNLDGWETIGDVNWRVENGFLIADSGSGYLVSEKTYQNFELLGYFRLGVKAYGGIFYRWLDETDRGYLAEFYNLKDAQNYTKMYLAGGNPPDILPVFSLYDWFPYQIIAFDRQSELRINGSIATQNLTHQKIRPGSIALYFHPDNDTLKVKEILIRQLETW